MLDGALAMTGTNRAHSVFVDELGQSAIGGCVRKNRALRLYVSGEFDWKARPAETSEAEAVRVHRIDKVAGGEHWQSVFLEQSL